MTQIVIKGEVVYQCNVCNRKIRVTNNTQGLSVIYHCIITSGCKGKLTQLTSTKDIINTPAIPPNEPNTNNWFQRRLLYTHTQSVPMQTWTIKHNLSNNPIFNVLINVGGAQVQKIPNTIQTIDRDTTNLIFDKSYSGIAQAISLSSQQQITQTPQSTSGLIPITNSKGLLTIATLSTNPIINTQFEYHVYNVNTTIIQTSYTVDNHPQSSSPWIDTARVHINGENYIVRSIDLILDPNNYHYFTNNDIISGSSIILKSIDNSMAADKSIVILLSSYPYGPIDKVYDKIIYLDQVTANQIIYENGMFFANPSIIKNIYPYIIVV